jgi:Chitobiase/beta-hexosaminidase C-terminal domain/Right handed beta helix region
MQSLQCSLQRQELPGKYGFGLLLGVLLAAVALLTLAGCGLSGSAVAFPGGEALVGSVRGGNQPISGSHVQLYATGTSGTRSSAQPLLSNYVESNSNGEFLIPAGFRCPSQSSQVFLIADGGNPGLSSGTNNQALALTAMLGSCSELSAAQLIIVDEVTTVGSIWPLAHYMKSPTDLGSTAGDTAFLSAVSSVPEFIKLAEGSSPGTPTPTSYFAQSSKLYSLADAISDCVDSAGGSAGDGSPCGLLFSMATPPGGTPPTDTITAAMQIAQNPENNVTGIFSLVRPHTPFQPTLPTAPPDWTLNLTYIVATPSISLGTGTYTGTQEVTISDSTAGSSIHYTTDGTSPTSSSPSYTGPISIAVSSLVQAIAVLEGSESGVASSRLTITSAAPASKLAFLQQPSNALTQATISPAVQVAVEDGNGNTVITATNPVTLALTGATGLGGTLTVTPQNGVATFSTLTVSTAGAYTLSATNPSLASATSESFTINTPGTTTTLAAAKLAFLQQPSNALTQATISPAVQVAVEDGNGNTVTTATNPVTLALTGATGLGGTLTATPQNGVATFSNLTVSTAGAYTLSATSPSLTSATSTSFTIITPGTTTTPTPAKLAFLQQPSNALTLTAISPAVQVAVEDSSGNTLTAATNPVTLALTSGTGLAGTLTVTPQNGVATFSNLTVSTAGTYTLSATSPSLTAATSTSFTISTSGTTAPTPAKLAFLRQPSNASTLTVISPAVQVAVEDSNGNTVTTATNPVILALTNGTGLGGTLTVTPQNGVATFSNLTVSNAGAYTLSATSPNLTSATSANFTISTVASTPTKLAFSQQPSNGAAGATITPAVTVAIEDANGNVVTSATNQVTLSLIGGTGLQGILSASAQNGVATFSNLSVSTAGSGYALSATSSNLTSATSTSFTISAASVVTNGTTVLPSAPGSISATPGGTFQITYNWQAVPVPSGYSVFVDFIDSSGTIQFQDNVQPSTSPTVWTGTVSYTHTVTVPSTAPVGTYKIVVGLNSTAGDLSLTAGTGVTAIATGEYQTGTLTLASTCSIAQFGAVGDGVTNNATAIQNTFNYAASHGCIALIPAGKFAYSGTITATSIAVTGTGAASILAPLDVQNEALILSGTGGSISNLAMVSTATSRLTTAQTSMIWAANASNYYVNNVLINGSASAGIQSYTSHDGYIFNNTVENTLADSIEQANPAYNITVVGNRILNSGDDGISNNSYAGGELVHDITVQGNTVLHNLWGRGLEVSGGSNIVFSGNYVDNPDGYADMYISAEAEWNTQGVNNVTVSGNTFLEGGPNQGAVFLYNSQGATYSITGVTVSGNQFLSPPLAAVQWAGNGSETGITLENNMDYATGALSYAADPLAVVTQTGNQMLAPSAFTQSLVTPGGGCTFSGC